MKEDYLTINSNTCIQCFKPKENRKALAVFVKDKDKDLLPFDYVLVPICLDCRSFPSNLDADFLWLNLLRLLEETDCDVTDNRFSGKRGS